MKAFLKRSSHNKGFTLMEVLIVLVIIAILAALLVPTLIGYVDIANENSCLVECRYFVTAAQTLVTERYSNHTLDEITNDIQENSTEFLTECFVLSELDVNGAIPSYRKANVVIGNDGRIKDVTYTDGYCTCTYTQGSFEVTEGIQTFAAGVSFG